MELHSNWFLKFNWIGLRNFRTDFVLAQLLSLPLSAMEVPLNALLWELSKLHIPFSFMQNYILIKCVTWQILLTNQCRRTIIYVLHCNLFKVCFIGFSLISQNYYVYMGIRINVCFISLLFPGADKKSSQETWMFGDDWWARHQRSCIFPADWLG